MNPLPFHILLALAAGDASAARLLQRAQVDVSGALIFRERGFYTALHTLQRTGFVTVDDTGRAAAYRLTPSGRQRLQAERMRLGHAITLLNERT